ncbi:MAG: hypothetical protein ACLU98_05440 [Desulfovibrio fairfieldensis]
MADVEQNLESLLERSSGTDVPLLLKAKRRQATVRMIRPLPIWPPWIAPLKC